MLKYNTYMPSYQIDIQKWEMEQIFDIVDIKNKKLVIRERSFRIENKNTQIIIAYSGYLDILSNILNNQEITLIKMKIEFYLKSRYVLFEYKQL